MTREQCYHIFGPETRKAWTEARRSNVPTWAIILVCRLRNNEISSREFLRPFESNYLTGQQVRDLDTFDKALRKEKDGKSNQPISPAVATGGGSTVHITGDS